MSTDERDALQHPIQPLAMDGRGVLRFKENRAVSWLANGRLNEVACQGFSEADEQQLAQLLGYSLSGYGELSYVTDEAWHAAEASTRKAVPAMADIAEPTYTHAEVRRILNEISSSAKAYGLEVVSTLTGPDKSVLGLRRIEPSKPTTP